MKTSVISIIIIVSLPLILTSCIGLNEISNQFLESTLNCSGVSNAKRCKKKLKKAVKIIAVGIAAKLIYDMVIDYKSRQISNEDKVINNYKKQHGALPEAPILANYSSSLKPGEIVTAGKKVQIVSSLEVIPGKNTRHIDIQERISIYDNEDHSKVLKSLTKPVNSKTRKSGAFKNEFTFTLPEGMPQGIYPIKTHVLIDEKVTQAVDNKMQLVLKINERRQYTELAMHFSN